MSTLHLLVLIPLLLYACAQKGWATEGPCLSLDDCHPATNGSVCQDGNCTCLDPTPVLVSLNNESYCLQRGNATGFICVSDAQCDYEGGECSSEGTCDCQKKFTKGDGRCTPYEKSSAIPIAVGIGLGVAVFGTVGLYLWMTRKKSST